MTTVEHGESVLRRAVRAARLDGALYREVALGAGATPQAFLVVMTVAIVGSLGGLTAGFDVVMVSVLLAPLAWVLTAALAQLIGTRVIGARGSASWAQVARALGFAHAPAVLGSLAVLPVLGLAVALVLVVWRVAAMLVAIRAAMAVSTAQAAMILLLSGVTLGVALFTIGIVATGGVPAD